MNIRDITEPLSKKPRVLNSIANELPKTLPKPTNLQTKPNDSPSFVGEPMFNADKVIKTKIVCTIGPSSNSAKTLEEMMKNGMDVARLNFAHGDYHSHKETFSMIREISARHDHQVAILCDIGGPKIRTGKMQQPFHVKPGDKIKVTAEDVLGTPERFQIKYPKLTSDIKIDDIISVNGMVRLAVREKTVTDLTCVVETGGFISDCKGCSLPISQSGTNILTEKDMKDLEFIAELNPEFVTVSYVSTASDIHSVRRVLASHGNSLMKVVAKIETAAALKNLDAIISVADGVMLKRSALAVEVPAWEVPIAQKTLAHKCNAEGKFIIVGAQMLDSMVEQVTPTRGEASDVFNAILDGADAVMLSEETAVGKYPVQVLNVLGSIIGAAEKHMPSRDPKEYCSKTQALTESIGFGAYSLVQQFQKIGYQGKVLVLADSGRYTARMVSKFRPAIDIVAFTYDLRTSRELNIIWGVRSVCSEDLRGVHLEERAVKAIKKALSLQLIRITDHVIVVSRSMLGKHLGSFSAIYDVEKIILQSGNSIKF